MKKLIFGLAVSALISAALAADSAGPATTTTPAVTATTTTASAQATATTGSKVLDPVKAAMGDGPCCTDGSCGETANRIFLSPRAAQLAGK